MTTAAAERAWTPTARQMDVLRIIAELAEEEYAFIGYGGAAGGGKTNLLAELALEVSIQCPGAKSLLGREHLVDLKTTTLAEFDKVCPPELLWRKYDSVPISRQIRLPDWPKGVVSTVFFRDVHGAKDSIGSEEYGFIGLEEAHEIGGVDIRYLFTRMRHRPEKKRFMVCAFNPFPSYVVDLFINGSEEPPKLVDAATGMEIDAPVRVEYVPARVRDNPHLPPNYETMLRFALGNDQFLLDVLLEGKAGSVPNSVYGEYLNNPEIALQLQVQEIPETTRFVRAVAGFDWGTSMQHKAAGDLKFICSEGYQWVMDAWESPTGSSNELKAVGRGWAAKARAAGIPITAAYDRSQGSLKDPLEEIFDEVVGGVRDVEGRIREGRGLFGTRRIRFLWSNPAVRQLWRYLTLYHRDDDDRIVEEQDDEVDAWHYSAYEAEHPTANGPAKTSTQSVKYKQKAAVRSKKKGGARRA